MSRQEAIGHIYLATKNNKTASREIDSWTNPSEFLPTSAIISQRESAEKYAIIDKRSACKSSIVLLCVQF